MARWSAWRWGRNNAAAPDAGFVAIAGAAWIAGEYLRAEMFTGYAWDPIGVVWVAVLPIARLATLVGTYALSGLTVVLAGALMLLFVRRWRLAAIAVPATVLAFVLGMGSPHAIPAPAAPQRVRVVQPNLGLPDRESPFYTETSFERLLALSGHPGPVPRLIVWPEGALQYLLEYGYPSYYYYEGSPAITRARIAAILGPKDVLLTGADGLLFDHAGNLTQGTNSIFALDARARIVGRYDKAHLVPYGEYLPLPWLLKPLGLARLVPGDVDFRPGPGPRDMNLPGFGAIGGQICYEIVFSGQVVDEAHRPRLIFNPSNDAWFGSWGPPQHLAQARMRAIEEGLPIVRSTPTGISAVIAADGRLLASMGLGREGAITAPIPPARAPTIFAAMGNWMALIVALLLAGLGVALRRRAR